MSNTDKVKSMNAKGAKVRKGKAEDIKAETQRTQRTRRKKMRKNTIKTMEYDIATNRIRLLVTDAIMLRRICT